MKIIAVTVCFVFATCFSFGQAYLISTIAGDSVKGYTGDSVAATNTALNEPTDVVIDNSGNMYIADYKNDRIRMINAGGIISTIAGNGIAGFSGDSGAATAAELYGPSELAIDKQGNLYFSDALNNRVREIDKKGIIYTVAGNGTAGLSGDGAAAIAAELNYPFGIALDDSSNLYIADFQNASIRKVNTKGIISTIAGNGTAGYSGDGGPAISAQLNYPAGVAVDTAGNIYIADGDNYCIRKINKKGIIYTIAGGSTSGYSGDGGLAINAELTFPTQVMPDDSGNIYITDQHNYRIRKINTSGIISTIAGNGVGAFSGDGGLATAAELNYPTAIAIDSIGNIYIADQQNYRIRKMSLTPMGIKELYSSNSVMVYPNPSSKGEFQFKIENGELKMKNTIEVFNVLGQTVYSNTLSTFNSQFSINLQGQPSGLYIYRIISPNGECIASGKMLLSEK